MSSPFASRGGVSPLNKGEKGSGSGKTTVRKVRAGDVGKRATNTRAQDKSGYSRSGADFINVHSFTGNTRLSNSLAATLGPSISAAVTGKQPDNVIGKNNDGTYSIDDLVHEFITETNPTDKPSFKEAWDSFEVDGNYKVNPINRERYSNDDDGYKTFEDAAKKWNKENPNAAGGTTTYSVVKDPKGNIISKVDASNTSQDVNLQDKIKKDK